MYLPWGLTAVSDEKAMRCQAQNRTARTESRKVSSMPRYLTAMLILSSLATTLSANAQEQDTETSMPRLGQQPGEPLVRSAPPSIPFGMPPELSKGNVLDFHGYVFMPMRVGVLDRSNPNPDQSSLALHSPPIVPGTYLRTFEYTGVLPGPWVQLNFSYGNSIISATAMIAATGVSDGGSGIYNLSEQLGVYDAFVTANLSKPLKTPVTVRVGAMTGRYGAMGAYDAGRYGTPLLFRTNSVGEAINIGFKIAPQTMLAIEQGIGGQLARVPTNLTPAGWNDYADPNTGASFVNHIHVGLSQANLAQLGLHYATAFSQDDQVPSGKVPDGRISVFGADARLTMGRFGHFYAGIGRTEARNSGVVSGVIEILNARGGPELIKYYLGPNSGGSGALTTFGAQYDLSVARAVYDKVYTGKSPDVLFSVFGIGTAVKSDDPDYDGKLKLKVGFETTYTVKSWFAVSGRFDHVRPDSSDDSRAFNVLSPRLLFHTDWQSRDEFALQYSYFINGGNALVYTGAPPTADPSVRPDKHALMLSGTYWW
jgi:hypothetical protein